MEKGWKGNGIKSGMESFFSGCVEWKKSGTESGMEKEWNNLRH